jgi:hypothetical protein
MSDDRPILGPALEYIHVIWLAARADDPQEYYDELDAQRWTRRCVRKFRDGRLAAYSYRQHNWRDVMPEAPIQRAADINCDTQFLARNITQDEFAETWAEAQFQERARHGKGRDQ